MAARVREGGERKAFYHPRLLWKVVLGAPGQDGSGRFLHLFRAWRAASSAAFLMSRAMRSPSQLRATNADGGDRTRT